MRLWQAFFLSIITIILGKWKKVLAPAISTSHNMFVWFSIFCRGVAKIFSEWRISYAAYSAKEKSRKRRRWQKTGKNGEEASLQLIRKIIESWPNSEDPLNYVQWAPKRHIYTIKEIDLWTHWRRSRFICLMNTTLLVVLRCSLFWNLPHPASQFAGCICVPSKTFLTLRCRFVIKRLLHLDCCSKAGRPSQCGTPHVFRTPFTKRHNVTAVGRPRRRVLYS